MAPDAVGYVRVSTREQRDEGASLEMQTDRISKYCSMQGLTLQDTILADEAVSGGKHLFRRPDGGGGATLAALTRSGELRNVVALKLDRLFRDAGDALEVTRTWDRQGVVLHIVDMGGSMLSTGGPMGRMVLTLLAGFAEWERSVISERTTAVLAFKRQQLEAYGPTPYGYDRAPGWYSASDRAAWPDKKLYPNQAELEVVARILAARDEGLSYSAIARSLNRDRIPTKQRTRWYATTVRLITRSDLFGKMKEAAS